MWAILLLLRGVPVDPHWFTSFSQAVFVVTVIAVGFDRYFSRLGPLCRLVPHRPVIQGTWAGYVKSSKQDTLIPAFLVIRQTLRYVSVSLLTDRGRSHTLVSQWGKSEQTNPAVHYTFRRSYNEPGVGGQPTIWFGSGVLEICGKPPSKIIGPYWTDVQTIGRLEFRNPTRKIFTEFDDAVEHLGMPALPATAIAAPAAEPGSA